MRRKAGYRLLALPLTLLLLWAGGCGEELPTPGGLSDGYERVVLAELFTAVWCGNCPIAEAALDRLVEEEGIERLAVIHWHPSFGAGDPFAIPCADERVTFYSNILGDQPGLPVNIFNGAEGISQGNSQTYDHYRARFERESALLSPIKLAITPMLSGSQVDASVQVTGFPGMGSKELDLRLVAVEHHAPNPGEVGPDTLSYTARIAATTTATAMGGQTLTRSLTLPLDPAWKRHDLFLVAFVQERVPAAGQSFREVVQACMVPLVASGEDFYGFYLSAPDTSRGIARSAGTLLPWSLHNTGTLADTLAVDLPASLQSLPAGWTVELTDAQGETLPVPRAIALAAGGALEELRLRVAAADAGEAQITLTARSGGDPALADTLRLHLVAGDFGFALSAGATEIQAVAGRAARAAFTLENIGTLADSLELTLPPELSTLPAGWTAVLTDALGTPLAAPHMQSLPAGEILTTLGLAVTPGTAGSGEVAIVARSRYAPELADTLRFQVTARLYDLSLSVVDSEVWAVVGAPASLPLTITNGSAHGDLALLDLPASLQSLPAGWTAELASSAGTPLALPYALSLDAGQSHRLFSLRVTPATGGVAHIRMTAASAGDPEAIDTLAVIVRADAYGFALSAPGGTDLALAPGGSVTAPLRLTNTGTLEDTLVLSLPPDLTQLPAGWTAGLVGASGGPILLPDYRVLAPGALLDSLSLRISSSGAGAGTVGLVVASTGQPELADTLTFSVSALNVYLTADATTIYLEDQGQPQIAEAGFTVHNVGSTFEFVTMAVEVVSAPAGWADYGIICDKSGVCYAPSYRPGTPLFPGYTWTQYVIHWDVPAGGGTGVVRLTATPDSQPAAVSEIFLIFTTESPAPIGALPGPAPTASR